MPEAQRIFGILAEKYAVFVELFPIAGQRAVGKVLQIFSLRGNTVVAPLKGIAAERTVLGIFKNICPASTQLASNGL